MVRMGSTNPHSETGDRPQRPRRRLVVATVLALAVFSAIGSASAYLVLRGNGSVAARAASTEHVGAEHVGAESVSAVGSTPSHGGADACTPARPEPAGTSHRILESNGLAREYVLDVPSGYDGARAAPLLIDLHGFGRSAIEEEAMSDAFDLAGERGFIVATPQGAQLRMPAGAPASVAENPTFVGKPWWNFPGSGGIVFEPSEVASNVSPSVLGADDAAYLTTLIGRLSSDLCVDRQRVYAMGMSNGAGMADELACKLGSELAGIGAVSGINIADDCRADSPTSIIAVHGDDDHIVPYGGQVLVGNDVGNPSVPARMAQWAEIDRCDVQPVDTTPRVGVTLRRWSNCADGVAVELWTVHGADHGWPLGPGTIAPGPINTTNVLLDFFDAHVAPAPTR